MVYQVYEEYKVKYLSAQKAFDVVLTEKERIFTKTQPNAIRYDQDKIQVSPDANMMDNYVIEMERKRINEKLAELRLLLMDRESLLRLKEAELRHSKDIYDRIYVLKYLEGKRVEKIAKEVGYSDSQVYRKLEKIDSIVKHARKCENNRDIIKS